MFHSAYFWLGLAFRSWKWKLWMVTMVWDLWQWWTAWVERCSESGELRSKKKLETVRKSPNMVAFIYQTMGIYPGYTQFASVFIVFAMLCLALLTTVTGPGDQPWWMGMYCNTQTWYVGLSNVFNRETWSCRCFIFCDKKSMWLPEESPDSANDIAESHLTVLSFRTNISADMTNAWWPVEFSSTQESLWSNMKIAWQ